MSPVAVITGGGTGIGAATAHRLAQDGFDIVVCGRRREPLEQTAQAVTAAYGVDARAVVMDVSDDESVTAAAQEIGACDVLVNNAGGAIGSERVEDGKPQDWRAMYESNVIGILHVTKALLPALRRSPTGGTIVVVSSVAGLLVYAGGAGYTAAKHGATAVTETLRIELNGEPIRVIEIDPGLVHTEGFSLTRFRGDHARADAVYAAVDRPLVAEDVAECIAFCVRLPQHVNVDRLVVKPVAQVTPSHLHRGPIDWDRSGLGPVAP
ncbi:MAG: SDR family NAD(P)-dependent oxidoreductase [Actinomycetales bacterium]|nr:SDR family NAD(P)-dependent oxidoreductase [Actinomycetales bacterium]